MNTKKLQNITLSQVFILYIIIYFACHFLSFVPGISIAVVGFFTFLLFCLKMGSQSFGKLVFSGGTVAAIAFICYGFMLYYSLDIGVEYYNTINNVINCVIIFILFSSLATESSKFRVSVMRLSLVGYFVTTLSTCINVIIDPTILRATASTSVKSAIVLGLGGYDFIYGLVIVNILLVDMAYRSHGRKRLFYVLFLTLSMVTLALSGYTYAFIFGIVFLAIALIFCGEKARWLLLGVPALGFFPNLIHDFVIWLSTIEAIPEIVRTRLYRIASSLVGETNVLYAVDGGARYTRYVKSFELIKEHPFLGNFLGNPYAEYGMHTEWIDRIAQYGILPFLLILAFWIGVYHKQKRYLEERGEKTVCLTLAYLYFVLLGIVNPATYAFTVFPLIVFVPMLSEILE